MRSSPWSPIDSHLGSSWKLCLDLVNVADRRHLCCHGPSKGAGRAARNLGLGLGNGRALCRENLHQGLVLAYRVLGWRCNLLACRLHVWFLNPSYQLFFDDFGSCAMTSIQASVSINPLTGCLAPKGDSPWPWSWRTGRQSFCHTGY